MSEKHNSDSDESVTDKAKEKTALPSPTVMLPHRDSAPAGVNDNSRSGSRSSSSSSRGGLESVPLTHVSTTPQHVDPEPEKESRMEVERQEGEMKEDHQETPEDSKDILTPAAAAADDDGDDIHEKEGESKQEQGNKDQSGVTAAPKNEPLPSTVSTTPIAANSESKNGIDAIADVQEDADSRRSKSPDTSGSNAANKNSANQQAGRVRPIVTTSSQSSGSRAAFMGSPSFADALSPAYFDPLSPSYQLYDPSAVRPPQQTSISNAVMENVVRSSSFVPETSFSNPSMNNNNKSFSRTDAMARFHAVRDELVKSIRAVKEAGGHPRSPEKSSTTSSTDAQGNGDRLMDVILGAVAEAERLEKAHNSADSPCSSAGEEEEAIIGVEHLPHVTIANSMAADWREDESIVMGQSSFFQSENALEMCNNRVTENILARGHCASTDEELCWLYRNTHLFSVLNADDLDEIVPVSLRREYSEGDLILNERSRVTHVRVVVWGEVDVFKACYMNGDKKAMESAFSITPSQANAATHARTNNRSVLYFEEATPQVNEDEVFYTHVATLRPGQHFGVDCCVFGSPSEFVFRAGARTKTVCSLIPFKAIERCLARNPRFSQSVGSSIAGSVNVFGPIREFCRFIFAPSSSQNEYLALWSILESYTRIHNVIHTKLFNREVDTGAWGYAIGRLPENLTTTFCFDLVHALPPFVASRMRNEARAADVRKQDRPANQAMAITYIRTKERRRCTWQLGMEGKTLVLLRDGFTDLLDFLTMLCVHIIESNKLRGRLQGMVHPPAIDILDEALCKMEESRVQGVQLSKDEHLAQISEILKRMPLSADEQSGLLRNWGEKTLSRMYEVMMHREEYNVRVDPSTSRKFQVNPFHEWALNLRQCVLQKLALEKNAPLPDDLIIDVISSNTHCIKNLLCSFNRKHRKELLAFVAEPENVKKWGKCSEWHCVDDMLYVALNSYLQLPGNEALRDEYVRSLEDNGITTLQDTAMTGLQVDVIPVYLLDLDTIDETVSGAVRRMYERLLGETGCDCGTDTEWESIRKPLRDYRRMSSPVANTSSSNACAPFELVRYKRHFIINMDFAFGAQAEGICRAIFSAFGQRIRSVNVMGKAGGLCGKRGDIQLATHVLLSKSSLILEDNQDELRSCRNQGLTKERLQDLVGSAAAVHHGKVLTVTGTMLQNVPLLRYYQRVWGCIGTEMEGSYFARVIEDFYRQGIANQNLSTRFAYYTSDLPLSQSDLEEAAASRQGHSSSGGREPATLSAPMTPQEGVPPLYAIARGILENIILA